MLSESNSDIESEEILNRFLDACISNSASQLIKATFLHPLQNKNVQTVGQLTLRLFLLIPIPGLVVRFIVEIKKDGINSIVLGQSLFEFIFLVGMQNIYRIMVSNKNKIYKGFHLMAHTWFYSNDTDKQTTIKTIKKVLHLCVLLAVTITLLCIGYIVATVFVPIITGWILNQTTDKNLPLHTDFLIDENKYFNQIFALHSCSLMVTGVLIGALNMFQCLFIAFLIAEMHNLKNYLKEIDSEYEREVQKNEACLQLYEAMKEVIRKHYQCIKLFETLDTIVRPAMLVAVVGTSFSLILSGAWAIILMQSHKEESMKMIFGFTTSALSLIIICTPGQILINSSDNLLDEIYFIKWENYPPKIRLMISLLMLRGMRPFALTGGPTFALNFETCRSILKTTLSFIATFRRIYDSN